MTNGEKIQTILNVDRDCTEVHGENGTMTFTVTQDFWDTEYKEPTTKNDLGVDCISREQAKEAIRDKFKDLPSRVEINTILNELPSVTSQEPILDRVRAEIEDLDLHYDNDYFSSNKDAMFKCDEVMQIIDKYKGESEKNNAV